MDPDLFHLIIDALSAKNAAPKISSLIVHYLSKHFASDYEWNDIETLMKMFVTFCENIAINGDQFVQLSKDEDWFLENSFRIMYNEGMNSGNFEIMLENIVLKSPNSIKSGIILDNILSYINKYLNCNIQLDALSPRIRNININRKKLYTIIERIFALPSSAIEKSIQALIMSIGFEILGYVFCETSTSIYFDKCVIMSDIICNKIEISSEYIENFFMPSIVLALKSNSGKSLFIKCLENKHFCCSLNLFLKNYLRNFANSLNSMRDKRVYLSYCQMSYIMYLNCNEINNRYLDIFTELNENKFMRDYLTHINMIYS